MLMNANAVIREHNIIIEVKEIDKVEISTTRVVTVLNEAGEKYIDAYQNFDEGLSILDQEAIIFNHKGEEIEKIKGRDFTVQSNFQDFVLFSDNKVSYLDYTPRKYPYTVKYTSRIRRGNTVFLPDWRPLEGYSVSVQKSSYKLVNDPQIPIRFTERNLDSLEILSENTSFELSYQASNIAAKSYEKYSPDFDSSAPKLIVALKKYALEGIAGEADNWEDFGKWQYEHLVAGQADLPAETINEVTELVKNAESDEEKARIIYDYVQNNTRYIAVMLGIGGWKPYKAEEVDRLGYGDCKGLTNYTRALLKSQGIDSDYTVIYGGSKRDIDPDFTKMQGNHVILSIPQNGQEDIWLECTSQDTPFNYLGDFTDDRFALKIKPNGGEIVRTPKYKVQENLQITSAVIQLNENGGFSANMERSNSGVPYGDIYQIELQSEEVQKNYYRENWSHFQNINFEEISFDNNKRKIEFKENLKLSADRFCRNAGDRLLVPLTFTHLSGYSIDKDENRKNNIQILRGKSFKNTFTYTLPKGYVVEALPAEKQFSSDFGEINFRPEIQENQEEVKIIVSIELQTNDGEWAPGKFKEFREFANQIQRINNLKAVIVSNGKT